MPEKPTYRELEQRLLELEKTESEGRQVEEALRKSERQMATLMSNLPGMAYRCTNEPGWPMIFVSEGCVALTGYMPTELTDTTHLLYGDLIHPDDREKVWNCIQKAIENEKPFVVEYRIFDKAGLERWVWEQGRVVDKDQFGTSHLEGFISEITERKQTEEALRESENKYRRLIESTETVLWEYDIRGDSFTFVSPQAERILGFAPEEWSNWQFWIDHLYPEDREWVSCHFADCMTRGATHELEYRFITKHGKVLWVRDMVKMEQHDGIPIKMNGCIFDIDDRKKAEEKLRKNEVQQSKMISNIGDVIVIIDHEGINRYKSPNIEKQFGWKPEEVVGTSAFDNVHHEDMDAVQQLFDELSSDPEARKTIECRYRCKDGSYKWIEFSGRNLLHDQHICGILGNYHNITERKQAEQRLQESEERFSKAFWSSPAPQVISDIHTGEFIDVNDRWVEMLGYTREEQIGRSSKEVGIWADPLDRDRIVEKLKKNRCFYEEPVIFIRSDGSKVYALWSGEAITLNGRNVMLSMIHDETESRQAEIERKKLQAQLNQSQKMESIGRLAGGVAHDFNNMLSIINGYAEMSIDMVDPADPLHGNLQEIYTAGSRSADIVRQLLAFARKQTVSPVEIDLNETVSNLIKMLQRLIGENIDLIWSPGNNIGLIKMDPSQIHQIMANLAVNARDSISDVGKLIIKTKNVTFDENYCKTHPDHIPGHYVMLAVSDDGCGMDQEILDNLFEPFFTTKGVGEGTGLGLPTVYGIVKQNNGFMNVYSKPGEGSVFKIYLPRHIQQESTSMTTKEPMGQVPKGSETVLMVEDEAAILQMGSVMLERLGYTVLTAKKPEDAVQIAEEYEGQIQLHMTDVIMPKMNGQELALRLSAINPGAGTLFMSGYPANVIAQHGVLDRDVQFIQKPFSFQDLAIKVRKAIDQD